MQPIAFALFSILFFAGCRRFVRFYHLVQETTDRRYPQYSSANDISPY
ncbi:MAG: hypothetical protein QM703_21165 [Gemmatales bacterium]